ncbi:CpsD/CapB family tyrosine-protein kinase [Sphingomonas sp. CCH5-D11]|uniref:CpsD/CapB family tyrosine-protein kinase n=1 Tax=Sphingomonas sp. CCH5-D11 TaxID=1768786 RepID=UPI000833223F|nr:CpsD/CapB family tyrosine-protein kinase [Sphingomonas sp. CCH5-D11]
MSAMTSSIGVDDGDQDRRWSSALGRASETGEAKEGIGNDALSAEPSGPDVELMPERLEGGPSTREVEDQHEAVPPIDDGAATDYAFSRRIVCLSAPDGAAAASYRAVQAHLLARHVGDGRRGLVLCSPRAGTGCTTVAVNLAVACAQTGMNTLLIDANMARPGVQDFIQPSAPASGLAQMLLTKSSEQIDQTRQGVRPNLSVLFAGDGSARARDLIAGKKFKEIVDHAMRSFDLTIVDTPAAFGNMDARNAAMTVRYAMIVARYDVTHVADMRQTQEDLVSDRVKVVGSFLTDF